MDAQQIYDNFHTNAPGTQGLAAAQDTAQRLAGKYLNRALDTQQMMDTIHSGWTGAASEAASQGLAPYAENAYTSNQGLSTGQNVVGSQIDNFHTTATKVSPVPPAPSFGDYLYASFVNPQPLIDKVNNRNSVQQANVDAYASYVAVSQDNTTSAPILNSLSDPMAAAQVTEVAPPPTAAAQSSGGAAGSGVRGSVRPVRRAAALPGSGGVPVSPGFRSPQAPPPVLPVGQGSTVISSAPVAPPPPPSAPPSDIGGPSPTGGPGPAGADVPVVPVLPVPGNASPGGPTSGLNGGPLSGEAGITGRGSGLSWGDTEPGGGSGASSGVIGGPAAVEDGGPGGEAARSSVGEVTSSAEEESMAAEHGTIGAPAGLASAGGRGQGGGDSEHRRRYGVPIDDAEMFGVPPLARLIGVHAHIPTSGDRDR